MDGPTECQRGQLDGLWRLSVSLTATGDLDLHYTESPLSRGTGGEVCVYNGQAGSLLTAETCLCSLEFPHNHIT